MTSPCDLKDFVMRECEVIDTHIHGLTDCSSKQVVDIGYGDGRLVAYFLSKGFYVKGVDNDCSSEAQLRANLQAAAIPEDNLQCECTDIKDYSFKNGENAVVIFSHVLHFIHADEAQLVISKAAQSVALNGMILIRAHHKSHPFKNQVEFKKVFKHFFSRSEIEQHFEKNFRLLHRTVIFGVPPHPEKTQNTSEQQVNPQVKYDFGTLSEEWCDVEYLYHRIA